MAKTVQKIKKTAKRIGAAIKQGVNIDKSALYDFSTPENREATAIYLYDYAKQERQPWVEKWQKYDNYYQGKHDTINQIAKSNENNGIPFIPACIQDPYMHVESMIIPDVPDFEFNGRDDDLDGYRAKQREYVVKYICDQNKIDAMNTRNERRLNKLGNAFWKVYWDSSLMSPNGKYGDIVITDVDPSNIFPDPSAKSLEDAEYVFYVYRLHKRKAARIYAEDLKKLDMTIDEFGSNGNYGDTQIYNSHIQDIYDDTVQIMEFWYKDDNGDVNCSILINEQEIRNTGLYWANTHSQCKLFPFVKYCKIADENNFWDRSEIESIIDLTDAADRELAYGLENAAFTSNDMIIVEDGALSDGETIKNQPGAIVRMKANKAATGMRRLGGLNSLASRQQSIEFMQSQIEKTIGNFDTSMGVEPDRVTSASGIAQLNERADSRKSIKKFDRIIGFEKLYELIDWTVLEFYDDDRLIFIGTSDGGLRNQFLQNYQQQVQQAQQQNQPVPPMPTNLDKNKGPILFKFNAESLANKKTIENPDDPDNPEIETYYPRVDCTVVASDSLSKSKAFTVQSLQTLISMGITIENYKIVEAWVDLLNLPQRKEIKDYLEAYFTNAPMGIPKTTLNYKDLSPDGKVQLARKIGLNIQAPAPADAQNVPYALLVQNAPSSGVNTPQIATTQNGKFNPQVAAYLDKIIGNGDGLLSPAELQYLQKHPEIIEQMLTEGANQNGQ